MAPLLLPLGCLFAHFHCWLPDFQGEPGERAEQNAISVKLDPDRQPSRVEFGCHFRRAGARRAFCISAPPISRFCLNRDNLHAYCASPAGPCVQSQPGQPRDSTQCRAAFLFESPARLPVCPPCMLQVEALLALLSDAFRISQLMLATALHRTAPCSRLHLPASCSRQLTVLYTEQHSSSILGLSFQHNTACCTCLCGAS